MKALVHFKEKAILLRKKGYTYKEILAVLPVAKSSVSLWLKDTMLTSDEKRVLKDRKDRNVTRGRIKAAAAARNNRLEREKLSIPSIKTAFELNKNDPLFQLGIGLYWAEGAKSSGSAIFTNSDVRMILILLLWLEKYTNYKRSELRYRLYIHAPYAHENCEAWWAKKLDVPLTAFTKTSFKPSTKTFKVKINYKGCMRVEIPKSSALLYTLKVWTNLMVEHHRN